MSCDGGHPDKTVSDPEVHYEFKKKWHIGNDYSHKWSLYWVITSKSLFSEKIKIWMRETTRRINKVSANERTASWRLSTPLISPSSEKPMKYGEA